MSEWVGEVLSSYIVSVSNNNTPPFISFPGMLAAREELEKKKKSPLMERKGKERKG